MLSTLLSKHVGARDDKLVTHQEASLCESCLTLAIAGRALLINVSLRTAMIRK